MHKRSFLLAFLCISFFQNSVTASTSSASSSGAGFMEGMLAMGALGSFANLVTLAYNDLKPNNPVGAYTVLGLFALSLAQKENKEFFSTCARAVEWPFIWTFKKLEQKCTGGYSLTYNHIASWHNRVARVLTPLTKTTAMVDLSKDRRLRIMDQEDGQDDGQDDQWKKQVTHIEREFGFMSKALACRLAYYKDVKKHSKDRGVTRAPHRVVNSIGKSFVRTSLIRNEEVAFHLEEIISYLKETVEYCKTVPHFSALDKEHMKRLMGNICNAFEHLSVLVDERSAADRGKNKIPMTADGSLLGRSSYSGSSYTSYDSGYGSTNLY